VYNVKGNFEKEQGDFFKVACFVTPYTQVSLIKDAHKDTYKGIYKNIYKDIYKDTLATFTRLPAW